MTEPVNPIFADIAKVEGYCMNDSEDLTPSEHIRCEQALTRLLEHGIELAGFIDDKPLFKLDILEDKK